MCAHGIRASESPALGRARQAFEAGKYAESAAAARQALAEAESAQGAESLEAARAIDALVDALRLTGTGTGPEAVEMARRAVRLKESALGPDHPEVALSLAALGRVVGDREGARAALPSLARAVDIVTGASGPEDPSLIRMLTSLAMRQSEVGEYQKGLESGLRALAIAEKVHGPESLQRSPALLEIGRAQFSLGKYREAEETYRQCLALREPHRGRQHPETAAALYGLGTTLRGMGNLAEARRLMTEAIEIDERALGADHPIVATLYNNLGLVLIEMNERAAAEKVQRRALEIKEKALGPDHPDLALTLGNLAELVEAGGTNGAEAKGMYERAIRIYEKAYGPDHGPMAYSLVNLGSLLRRMGEIEGARGHQERALRLFEKSLGPEHPHTALSMLNLGETYVDLGRSAEGADLIERAVAAYEASQGSDSPDLAAAYLSLAWAHWAAGRWEKTFEASLRAEHLSRNHFRRTSRSLAEEQALNYLGARYIGLNQALTALLRAGGRGPSPAVGRAWDEVIRSRALVLDEMASRRRFLAGQRDESIAALASELRVARSRLARRAVVAAPLESERRESDRLEQALADAILRSRGDTVPEPGGLQEVARALPAESALVAYVHYFDFGVPPPDVPGMDKLLPSHQDPVASYLAFVLSDAGTSPRVVPLGTASEVEAALDRWRQEVARAPSVLLSAAAGAEERYRAAGEALRRKIWDPLVPHLRGARRVFVVPEGGLHNLSFASLPSPAGGYLLEHDPALHYLSAERDLAREGGRGAGSGLFVVGMPDYENAPLAAAIEPSSAAGGQAQLPALGSLHLPLLFRGRRSACGDFNSVRFRPLPSSRLEAEEISLLWRERRAPTDPPEPVDLRVGGAASETAFKLEAPGHKIIHLATHGFFVSADCASAPGQEARGAQAGPRASEVNESPLLLSGLAFAGANRRLEAGDGGDDGILTAEEMAMLDLRQVEWVVLSACETGVGKVQDGEGVLGLRRAVEVAGASTLIMSLWPVDDAATREWMRGLYGARLGGAGSAEAVREAGRGVLEARRRAGLSTHPFYWGAFVAAGDWR